MSRQQPKKPALPFSITASYPSSIARSCTKYRNIIYNRLFPVRPAYFGASVALLTAVNVRYPNNILIARTGVIVIGPISRFVRNSLCALIVAYAPVFVLRRFIKHVLFTYKRWIYETDGRRTSIATKIWRVSCILWLNISSGVLQVCMYLLHKSAPPMLHSCDALLPHLPVPSLAETIRRYLESIKPLLSADEYRRVEQLACDFEHGAGRKLQFYLCIYAWTTDNYVTDLWQKYAYLYSRAPLLINSSVAHVDLIEDLPADQATRAAHTVYIEMMSMLAIDNQSLKPLGNLGITLAANHYESCYAVTRIPGETMDKLKNYGISRHVAVYSRGCFYAIDAFDGNRIRSISELRSIFIELLNRDDIPNPGEDRLAALTTDKRNLWAVNRQKFFNSTRNRQSLERIESSAFFLVLDDQCYDYDPNEPSKLDEFLRSMLTGDGSNRWADKSLSYTVSKNARCGGTTEHSIGDGLEFDHLLENFVAVDVYGVGYDTAAEHLSNGILASRRSVIERINFDLSDECRIEIDRCYAQHRAAIDDVDLASTIFRDFGKGHIKTGNVSPDAFIQMALQLAIYKDQGKFVLTYESASTRLYANARTETLRTVSHDSCAFVNAMLDSNVENAERLRLLRTASLSHALRNRDAMTGKGVDRHLFVLYILSKYFKTNNAFLDYVLNEPWILSTSQAPTVTAQIDEDADERFSWLGACFGAVAHAGYGVCYRFAGQHSICAHITSYKSAANTDSHRFRQHLIESFHEIAALFTTN